MAGNIIIEEQHPIPQQISSFQFRLVGDMTLKQFFQIAAGAIIALLLYASGLPTIIKWPLIFISFGAGAALAFLPFEDRPLAQWIFLFFKSIYAPTQYVWKKKAQPPQFFQDETKATVAQLPVIPTVKPTPVGTLHEEKLEEKEKSFLSKIIYLSRSPSAQPRAASTVATGVAPVFPSQKPDVKPPSPKPKLKAKVVIPQKKVVAIPAEGKRKETDTIKSKRKEVVESTTTIPVSPILKKADSVQGKQAEFSQEAAPPIPPNKPNVIVGQVVDPDGKIVEGAILEIKDSGGRPVRAFKTNKLGHFMIVTSLIDGNYTILTEKNGLVFEPISFQAKGEVIPPIAIWAKEKVSTKEPKTVDEKQIYNI